MMDWHLNPSRREMRDSRDLERFKKGYEWLLGAISRLAIEYPGLGDG